MSPAVHLAYDPNNIKPGWIALVIVALLGLATFLLWRSMNTQLGKIRAPYKADVNRDGSLKQHPADPAAPDTRATDEDPDDPGSGPPPA